MGVFLNLILNICHHLHGRIRNASPRREVMTKYHSVELTTDAEFLEQTEAGYQTHETATTSLLDNKLSRAGDCFQQDNTGSAEYQQIGRHHHLRGQCKTLFPGRELMTKYQSVEVRDAEFLRQRTGYQTPETTTTSLLHNKLSRTGNCFQQDNVKFYEIFCLRIVYMRIYFCSSFNLKIMNRKGLILETLLCATYFSWVPHWLHDQPGDPRELK